jgi:hypothetical protein
MESRLGHRFDRVRVHTDRRAAQSADAVAARAYTVGSDIAFRAGEYDARSSAGQELLAHELTHVIQQGAAPSLDSSSPAGGALDAATVQREPVPDAAPPQAPAPAQDQALTGAVEKYRFEIKAWIPFAHVPDPEEPLHEIDFRLSHSERVSDYTSQYRGDGHAGYEGSYRVLQAVEFDWDGVKISKVTFPGVAHFGTSHRDFSATLTEQFAFPPTSRFVHDTDIATVGHAVSGAQTGPQAVDIGMASPNPLTIGPSPDIDADYSFFISRDPFGDTITVRWSTDFMPNHGFRVSRNGTVVKEKIVNALPGAVSSPEIFIRLNSKSNGGADMFTPPGGGR